MAITDLDDPHLHFQFRNSQGKPLFNQCDGLNFVHPKFIGCTPNPQCDSINT